MADSGQRPETQQDEMRQIRQQEPGSFTRRTLIVVGISLVALLLVAFVLGTAELLLLVFAGVLLAVFLRALSDWVSAHTGIGSGWSLAGVGVGLLALLGGIGWLLGAQIANQFGQLSQELPGAIQQFRSQLEQYSWGQQLLAQMPQGEEALSGEGNVLARVGNLFSTTLGLVTDLGVILFIGSYVAVNPTLYVNGIVRLAPFSKRQRVRQVLHAMGYTLRHFLVGRAVAMLAVGIAVGIGLTVLGVPLALPLALIAAVLDFIPNIGPLIAAAPAILLALTQSPTLALYVVVLYLVIQTVEGYIVTPLVQEREVELPPALTIVAEVILGVLLGGLGLVMATPLAAILLVLVKMVYVEDTLGDSIEVRGEESA